MASWQFWESYQHPVKYSRALIGLVCFALICLNVSFSSLGLWHIKDAEPSILRVASGPNQVQQEEDGHHWVGLGQLLGNDSLLWTCGRQQNCKNPKSGLVLRFAVESQVIWSALLSIHQLFWKLHNLFVCNLRLSWGRALIRAQFTTDGIDLTRFHFNAWEGGVGRPTLLGECLESHDRVGLSCTLTFLHCAF